MEAQPYKPINRSNRKLYFETAIPKGQFMKIYSIRDAKANSYLQPFFCLTEPEARRNFAALVMNPSSMPGMFPDDFDLYELGEYDGLEGKIKPNETPRHIQKAISVEKPQ